MNIAFDLDKIFVNHPPLVPSWLINKLYGEKFNGHLSYRVPGRLEQKIRKLSHASFLRPIIQKNIVLLQKIGKNTSHKLFLISSRYEFLKKETKDIINRNHFESLFTNMYFNYHNEQPHLFKDAMLIAKKINVFVDDDLPLLRFLAKKHKDIRFFWLNNRKDGEITKNLYAVSKLMEVFKKL